jgi:Arc/MetJ-type ribon-helix-helix transcriptional regulator
MNDEDKANIGVRVSPEIRAKIMELVGKGKEYSTITDFVIAAIEEKLDPMKRVVQKDFNQMLFDALEQNPKILEPTLHRIGVEFHVRKRDD